MRIEDHALIGDTQTAALVRRDGVVDWLCLPRFDSPACFAMLLGDEENGAWRLAPRAPVTRTTRRYREGTLVLETEHTTPDGVVRVVDTMPTRAAEKGDVVDLVRVVEGVSGRVDVHMDLRLRFDHGSIVPWVSRRAGGIQAVAGPDAVLLTSPADLRGEDRSTVADLTVGPGDRVPFVLTWFPSHQPPPDPADALQAIGETEAWWRAWSGASTYAGRWPDAVERSLVTLKALTYAPTGAIVAAPTTSLPEWIGGARNWDYRYSWLRDATFTLFSLLSAGYRDEAVAWRDWLLRAAAGDPEDLQIMYGIAGERRLPEQELPWLAGFAGSAPVRVGNGAHGQLQLDVYGEVIDAMHHARQQGIEPEVEAWELQRVLLEFLEGAWDRPDNGLWEGRGERRHFTHSKVMSWVAFDRAVRAVEASGLDGPIDRWRRARDEVHREVCDRGVDGERGAFVRAYGSRDLDASLLVVPQVGFLPPDDPRVVATVEAIDRELTTDDVFVRRYEASGADDGFDSPEGAFLLCSFWMVDALALIGREAEAERRFERLLALRNDVGLLSEEYDPDAGRMLGNFPQAFSHVGLVNSAGYLSHRAGAATDRAR